MEEKKEEIKLIFEKTKKKNDFTQLHKIIFGFPKTGKTSIVARFIDDKREPLFISTEDGTSALEVYAQRVTSWQGFKSLADYIIKNTEAVRKQHSTIVIDLVGDLDDMCQKYICEKYKVLHLSDLAFGKGYNLHIEEFKPVITALMTVLPCVFIAHSAEKDYFHNGETVKIQVPTISKKTLEWLNGKVDITGFIVPANSKNDKPYLTFRQSKMALAGTRFSFMTERDFTLDYKDLDGSYKNINEYFKTNTETKKEVANGK